MERDRIEAEIFDPVSWLNREAFKNVTIPKADMPKHQYEAQNGISLKLQ